MAGRSPVGRPEVFILEPLAAIFDLDGVLVDSEPTWSAAEIAVFGRAGLALGAADTARTRGLRIDEVVAFWAARGHFRGQDPAGLAAAVVDEVCAGLAAAPAALPGAVDAVRRLHGAGVRLAVASSSPRRLVAQAVASLGLEGAFDALCSAEALPLGKPHPAVYLEACGALRVAPTRAVAVEDSLVGLVAAKAARCRCVAVPAPADRAHPGFGLADLLLPDLRALDLDTWFGLDGAEPMDPGAPCAPGRAVGRLQPTRRPAPGGSSALEDVARRGFR
jgi:mannitol-1-/sugar-/sorbitol-6-/2-deoxyglucose-6-phosphatase